MTKQVLFVSFLLLSHITFAQDKYIVRFTDKNNFTYSLANPQAFLTQKAIDRRNHQNIALDSSDLPVNDTYIQGVINAGATVLNRSKWFNSATIQTSNPAVLSAIAALPYVQSTTNIARITHTPSAHNKFDTERIEPVKPCAITAQRTTSFNYGNGSNQTTMININALHDLGYTGEGMTIAVIDAGFNSADVMPCFDSLRANNQILGTWDFVHQETNVYDDYYHGSAVLSCMAANVPGDLVGTAPKANYWLLESEDASTEYIIEEYNWASAAEFADSVGADVINSSLGYTDFDSPFESTSHTYADMDGNTAPCTIAADKAVSKGMIVVNSAGNSGGGPWQYIGAPADGDSVLSIGAVDASGNYAFFSSTGPTSDGRIKPDVADQGQDAYVFIPGGTTSQPGNGTSFASPIMAGAVTCLWQAWPNRTNMDIIRAVKQSASQFNNPDSLLGYGIPNFGNANLIVSSNFQEVNYGINVFPNPIINGQPINIQIVNDSQQVLNLELTDMLGKVYYEHQYPIKGYAINEISFTPPSGMSSGIYFLRMQTEDHSYLKKVMKL